jgi:diguanylate cyclase
MDSQTPRTTFQADEYIFKNGDSGQSAYIIESGKVEVLLDTGGHEIVIASLGKGDILGETALIDRLPRSSSARAIVDTEVIEIPLDYFSQKMQQADPTIRMFLRLVMARYRDLKTRLGKVAASLAAVSEDGRGNDYSSATMELQNMTSLYSNLQNLIDSAVTNSSDTESSSAFSEGTMEFAKVMVTEEMLLRKAVENNEFVMYYQPIIDLARNKMVGCEALIRWNHPSGELVLPTGFISKLEKSNLMLDLGYWIAEQACRFQNRIYQQFHYNFFVAINLSGKQFDDQNLVSKLSDIMDGSGAWHNRIEFEITESILIENPDRLSKSLHELKETGAGLAIDDFGTGYSSFSNLYRLPFDKLKIDQSFIRSMERVQKSKQIVKSMINMSHDLGMSIVAEGIESRAEVDILNEYKATYGQGFYFSRPISEDDFLKLLLVKPAKLHK